VDSGAVYSVTVTPANRADISELPTLLRDRDEVVFADAGYASDEYKRGARMMGVNWCVQDKRKPKKNLSSNQRKRNRRQSSVRARGNKSSEPQHAALPFSSILELLSIAPHHHQGPNRALSLAVGLRAVAAREFLSDACLLAWRYKGVAVRSFVLFTVIRVAVLNGIRAFLQHLL